MKKIGIITVHNSPSYGASLQSFALWKYLDGLSGCECEIIDLYRPYQKEYAKSDVFVSYNDKTTKSEYQFKRSIINIIKRILHYHIDVKLNSSDLRRLERFNEFNKVISLSKPYFGPDELYNDPPLYDVYISGSDQIWNPEQPWSMEPYFLTFAPKNRIKISYASSIGLKELPKGVAQDYKRWLSDYRAIGVRENSAKTLLASFGVQSTVVCDPTFLLDSSYWKKISVTPKERDYILLFILQQDNTLINYAIKVAKESGKQLILLCQDGITSDHYKLVPDAGPKEFIGYIGNANLVITNSFHGTAFSIIMNVNNFFAYVSPSNKRGSRLIDLLATYELSNHLLNSNLHQSYSDLKRISIDHEKVLSIMASERKRSQTFIKENI